MIDLTSRFSLEFSGVCPMCDYKINVSNSKSFIKLMSLHALKKHNVKIDKILKNKLKDKVIKF